MCNTTLRDRFVTEIVFWSPVFIQEKQTGLFFCQSAPSGLGLEPYIGSRCVLHRRVRSEWVLDMRFCHRRRLWPVMWHGFESKAPIIHDGLPKPNTTTHCWRFGKRTVFTDCVITFTSIRQAADGFTR